MLKEKYALYVPFTLLLNALLKDYVYVPKKFQIEAVKAWESDAKHSVAICTWRINPTTCVDEKVVLTLYSKKSGNDRNLIFTVYPHFQVNLSKSAEKYHLMQG